MTAGAPGIGVDIIAISRMRDAIDASGQVFMDKVFTSAEQARARTHPSPAAYLAMTFAAKEAVFKTLGTGWDGGGQFSEIEIRDGVHGEPLPVLSGSLAEAARERGVTQILVSLSNDGDFAVAAAISSGTGPGMNGAGAP
ncbi:MAG: holo-ACP synthase [Dehalococcoidia bacterium]